MNNRYEPLQFIEILNRSDPHINKLYSRGSCYQFSLLLQTFYPDSTIYIRKDKKHTALMIAGQLYDVSGRVEAIDHFTPIIAKETVKCEGWSSNRNLIMIEKKVFKQIEQKINVCQRIIYVSYTIGQLASILGIYLVFNYLTVASKPEFKWFVMGLMIVSIIWMQQLKKRHIE